MHPDEKGKTITTTKFRDAVVKKRVNVSKPFTRLVSKTVMADQVVKANKVRMVPKTITEKKTLYQDVSVPREEIHYID